MLPKSTRHLLRALNVALGPSQAHLEFKWIKQAVSTSDNGINKMLQRRLTGEPLQYVLGSQPFGPLNLLIRPPVLIPRPETEHWVVSLADALSPTAQNPYKLLDLGTGSGCIPLLLCHLWQRGSVHAHGIDISPMALELARENARFCNVPKEADPLEPRNTLTLSRANMLSPTFLNDPHIDPPYNVITSNPPYISWSEFLDLPKSVVDFEDAKALFGGPFGLDFYYAIARIVATPGFVKPGGTVALEVGHAQAITVQQILHQTAPSIKKSEIWQDPWGKQRTVIACV